MENLLDNNSKKNEKVGLEITYATPDDVLDIQNVFYKTWLTTYPNEEIGITVEDIEDKFKDAFSEDTLQKRRESIQNMSEDIKLLVAKDNEKVIGICRLTKREKINQLQAIYVLPEYQGMGIGYKFWNEALKFFDDKKNILVQVAEYNRQAIEFYKKLGFVDNGRRFTEERHRMKSGALIPEMELEIKR